LVVIKHVYTYAENFEENKTKLTAVIVSYQSSGLGEGTVSQSSRIFILPDESSSFVQYSDDLFASSSPPSNIFPNEGEGLSPKAVFRKKIVNYVISTAAKNNINYDQINQYFDSLLRSEQAQNQIITDSGSVVKNIAEQKNKKQEQLETYEASIETESPEFSRDADDSELSIEDRDDSYETGNDRAISPVLPPRTPEEELNSIQIKNFGDKPTEGSQRPVINLQGLNVDQTKCLVDHPESSVLLYGGLFGGRLIEPVPESVIFPGDAFLKSENNSGLICSRDELYRPRGHGGAGAIYLYAGKKSVAENQFENFSNPKLNKDKQPNNLIADHAYVYLSQKADVDSLYKNKVARGKYTKVISPLTKKGEKETRKGLSLAAIKADDVLIMSRVSGIRLVTGTDKARTDGEIQYGKYGIDLIAGNDDEDLQPLVKGDNLVKYLSSLSTSIDELRSVFYDFMNSQSKFNSIIASHNHYDQFGIFLGTVAEGNPLSIRGGKGYRSEQLQAEGTTNLLETIRQQYNSISSIMNRVSNDVNGLQRLGAYKILSEKNRTN